MAYTAICGIVKDQASILPCQHSLKFMMPDLSAALPFPVAQVPEENDPAGFPDGYMAICAIVSAPQFKILTGLCGVPTCVVVLLQVPVKDEPAEFPDGYMAICAIVKALYFDMCWFLCWPMCHVVLLQVPEKDDPAEFPDGYMAICAIVKNQVRDIREWLEYHRWLGVGKVYVYDNNSTVRRSAGTGRLQQCVPVTLSLPPSLTPSLTPSLSPAVTSSLH
jgi:hypothetical protein